jgi:elongation factor Tu
MSNVGFQSSGSPFRIATAGHEGHGKTSLTTAIVNALGGRAAAGAERVEYATLNRRYVHVDCSGDIESMRRQIAGGLDGLILVISATDGPMAGTRDSLKLARQMGVGGVVVYLSHADEIDDVELFDLTEMEIRDLLVKHEYPGDTTPIIRGCSVQMSERGNVKLGTPAVLKLMAALHELIPQR